MAVPYPIPYGGARSWAPAVCLFAAAFAALAWPWLSGAVVIPWDSVSQFFPQQAFLARSIAQGQSPFWTTNVFAGWPQIADPQSLIFSPPHLLLALITARPSLHAFDAVTLAMLFIGGVGMMLLFRDRGWHPAAAVIAALAFAFGGSCAARIQHVGQVMSIAYLPPALWLTARALERPGWMAGFAAGVAAAMVALGRDQVGLLALYVLVAFVMTHVLTGAGVWKRLRASAKPLAAAMIAGAAVVALPLAMTALLALDSNRASIDYVGAGRGSLHPAHLLTLAVADLYGANDPAVPYWGPPSFTWGPTDLFLAQNMGQLYAGSLIVVSLAGIGAIRGVLWARDIRFFTVAALVVLLYAVGWYTPAFRVMYEILPGVSLFRRPADATFLLGALVAILGGYGVHRLLSGLQPMTRRQKLTGAFVAALVSTTALLLALSVGTLSMAAMPILTAAAWMLGAVAMLAAAVRLKARPIIAALMLTAFACADLAWNNGPNESTGLPPAGYEVLRADTQNETIALIEKLLSAEQAPDRRDRIELTGIGYHWPNLGLVHNLDQLFGHNPLRLKDFALATGVGDTVAVADQRTFAPLFPSYRSALADLFGLRYIATGVPVEQIDPRLKAGDLTFIARTRDAYVYENPRALPRVMLFTDWRQADFAAMLRDGWPADVDPARTALIEKAIPPLPPAGESAAAAVRINSYANTEVVIDATAPRGGLVVLNDIWHPWWCVELDGAPAEMLKANLLFRAVRVPPGRHTVRFTFRPFAGALAQIAGRAHRF